MALFAHETEFWIEFTRIFWLDEGYVHPLFSPFINILYSNPNYNFYPQIKRLERIRYILK